MTSQREVTIAVDTWPLLSKFRNTGIYVYAKNLLSHFRRLSTKDSVQVRPLISRAVANDANQFASTAMFRPYETNLLRIGRVWRYGGACLSAANSKADLLFCPSGTTLPFARLVPVVATIHDVTPVVFPSFPRRLARGLRFAFANTARFSRAILTDSLCSKRDLIDAFGVKESSVHVVYLGCDESFFNAEPADPNETRVLLEKLGIRNSFLLHHGTIQPRKNLKRLIEGYRLALSRNPNLEADLVLVGDLGWQFEETLIAANASGAGRVVLTGPMSDADLSLLLKAATASIIPSLYEGFCLPLLESMACGTATVCSNSSCLPEISGGALRYFNPLSIDEIAISIEHVLDDAALRQLLSCKGKERSGFFSWRKCAEQTLSVLKTSVAQ